MRYFVYPGPEDTKELCGRTFRKGEPVEVADKELADKCIAMGFVEVEYDPSTELWLSAI